MTRGNDAVERVTTPGMTRGTTRENDGVERRGGTTD